MESYEQCGQGRSYCSLCILDTIHRLFFVTRLIINKINKVQWVGFKLENVLVSLHSLKTMGLRSIIFKVWRVTWTFSYTYQSKDEKFPQPNAQGLGASEKKKKKNTIYM